MINQEIQQENSHQGTFYKIPKFGMGFFSLELAEKFLGIVDTTITYGGRNAIANYGNHTKFWGCGWHVEALCWERHGYHDFRLQPPEWYATHLEKAKNFTPLIEKPELELLIYEDSAPEILNYWITDKANPWVLPYSCNTEDKNKVKGKQYIESCFEKSSRIYTLTMDAWRYYKKTGEPVMPAWVTDRGLLQHDANGKSTVVYKRCPADFE